MKLDENLTDAIDYTKLLFADLGRLLILIVLAIIPIVDFVVLGYLGNVMKAPKDPKKLPPLENYFDLWFQGLKILIIALIYMIIPLVFIIPFLDFWGVFSFLTFVRGTGALLLLLVGVLLAFFLVSILYIAIINMLKHNDLSKAFAFGEILGIIEKVGWVNYILWLLVIFVCSIIVTAIGSIPVIGWFLSLMLAPVFGVFVARSVAFVYLEATEVAGQVS